MPIPGWIYDLLMRPLGWLGLTRVRRRLVRDVRGRTLEVGAGTGLNLNLYGPEASPLIALDVDREGLLRARSRQPRAWFVQASAEALPFRGDTFDSVVSCLVFCSVPHPAQGLGELRRVLRGDGDLKMLEHIRPSGRLLGWLADRVTPLWRRVAGGCCLDRRTPDTLLEAGLAPIHARRFLRGAVVELRARRQEAPRA
jgi:ubiquinone/menaquinone biosynthesis C-methylase UbiE